MPAVSAPTPAGRGIALVGRRGEVAFDAAAAFLTQLGVEPVVRVEPGAISDEPPLARLEHLRAVACAVVVPSARDAAAGLLEIGFLLGALGRERICLLASGQGAPDPQLEGLPVQAMDEGGLWRLLLARQMKQAGLEVDLNRAV